MKIIYILNKVSETSIPLEMANLISQKEHVIVISLYDSYEAGLKVVSKVSPNCKFITCNGRKNKLTGLYKLSKLLKNNEECIIHTHQTLSGAWARYITRNMKNKSVVHTIHANHNSFNKIQNLIIGCTLKYADFIVANSNTTWKGLKKWQGNLIKNVPGATIYNGVNVERILNVNQYTADKLLEKKRIKKDEFLFGTVGRFVKVKNYIGILKSFEKFLLEINDPQKYRLLLIGSGPEEENIKELINSSSLLKEQVTCIGLVDRDTVYGLLHKLDVFIMASFYEGFCNALMEAKVVGLKTIVSDIDIFNELFEKEKSLNFNPNNIDEIKDCMIKAVDSEKVDKEIVNELRNKFDISTSANKYLDIYQKFKN
ncbi:MAG: glycosyltransferase [Atopostipes sp.]|nr:glycosyltransferase [Atopostipes sp.]